jgi:intracellular multiplication protein IcmQ
MKDKLSEEQLKAILKALDSAVDEGPWEESNFLRVIGKKLREIRDQFANNVEFPGKDKNKVSSHLANRVALRSGQREIFIALYSSTGIKIQSWAHIIANLPKQSVSRAIYANEQDVKDFIRAKENPNYHGYVSIYVNQNDILSTTPEKTPVDKLGKSLLSLKGNVIKIDNITRFEHATGTYQYSGGRMVKINANESK